MKFNVMDQTGHSTIEFTEAQRAEASALFAKLLAEGKTLAVRKNGQSDYDVARKFDETTDEVLAIPRLKGG